MTTTGARVFREPIPVWHMLQIARELKADGGEWLPVPSGKASLVVMVPPPDYDYYAPNIPKEVWDQVEGMKAATEKASGVDEKYLNRLADLKAEECAKTCIRKRTLQDFNSYTPRGPYGNFNVW